MNSETINSLQKNKEKSPSEIDDILQKALTLINRCDVVMVGNNGSEGFPQIKAMFKMENEGLNKVWFSTNTSSKRVSQFLNDDRACLYFLNEPEIKGLMLVGHMQVLQDETLRQRFWREGCEKYYPLGVNDPDYTILCFIAQSGNYYHGLKNLSFDL